MKEKSKMIISYLNSSDTYTPSSALAQYLNVSERSIKRYIKIINKELEEFGAKIDSAKGLGYRLIILDDEKFKEYIKNTTGTSIDESVRSTDLLKRILKSYPISLDLLAEELYTSRSTLQNEINSVKSLLNEYEIDLKYKPYMGLYLDGDEEDIRKCCIKYFFKEDNFNEIKLSVDLELINNDFVKKIKKYIEKKCLSRNKIKNDYEITYLTKFIVISCFRFINGYKVKNKIENMNKEIIFIFDDKFRDMINDSYNIHLDDNEIINMNILAQVDKEVSIDQKPKEDQVRNIIQESLIKIDIKYKVFLYEDNTLLLNLVKHIMNSYHRYYLKIDVENVILDQVKMSYPEAFNYALELSNLLEDKLKVKINSNEIGYIAIHFATAIERAKQKTSYKSIIVCNTGIGTSELIRTKLRRYFPEIEIVGCYQLNYIEYIDLDEVDFIISTINIEKTQIKNKELIHVSHVLSINDIQKIEDELNKIYLQNYLKSLFNINTFYCKLEMKNKNDLIEFVTNDMVSKNIISKDDKIEIIKRENLSSTEISDLVAVPHCISKYNKNAIAICTLKNPLKWGSANVKLVFIACLNSDIKDNKHVFPFIHSRTKKGDIVNNLCECTSVNEFIQTLMGSNNYDC